VPAGTAGALVGLVVVVASRGTLASPLVPDAVSLARGGQTALAGIDASPASPRPRGWRFRIDAFEPFAGTGLLAAAAGVEWVGGRAGGGFAYATLWSPVGDVREFAAGLQLRHGSVAGGCGIQLRAYELMGYATVWEPTPRAGIGWRGGPGLVLATVVERGPGPAAHPRLRAGLDARVVPGIRCTVLLEREPGVASCTAIGVATGEAPFCVVAGFDVATQAYSIGFAWSRGQQGIAWGARTHPVLGWSHAWTYERSH